MIVSKWHWILTFFNSVNYSECHVLSGVNQCGSTVCQHTLKIWIQLYVAVIKFWVTSSLVLHTCSKLVTLWENNSPALLVILHLWQHLQPQQHSTSVWDSSGAPATRRCCQEEHHSYRNRTTCMHRNRNACNSIFMVSVASGIDHGQVHPTTTTKINNFAHN